VMFVLGNSRVTDGVGEGEVLERVECLPNLLFREFEYRVAAGALVARVEQSVKRKRVILGCRNLFFDQRAENAKLDGIELHIY